MTQKSRVLIASDHAGVRLKQALQKHLIDWEWIDLGPLEEASIDYPDFARSLGEQILDGEADQGVLICGSGIGMSIAANKIPGIRAALVENPIAAKLAREHNHANILCLGSRFIAPPYGAEIVKAWLEAECSSDSRHLRRLEKIKDIENLNIKKDSK